MEKLVLIGAGGHMKVAADILAKRYDIVGVTDADAAKHNTEYYGIKVIGNDDILPLLKREGVGKAFITLGSIGNSSFRKKLYTLVESLGFELINAISPNSIISPSVILGKGNLISDRAVIHADTVIGNNTILNTGCIVEHDCVIGDHVHISPGVVLAGGVRVGEGSHIGLGASIIQGIEIGSNCVIGAGAVVIGNVPDYSTYAGVPARSIKKV